MTDYASLIMKQYFIIQEGWVHFKLTFILNGVIAENETL